MRPKARRGRAAGFSRGEVLIRRDFLEPGEVERFVDWEARCAQSLEKSEEKNEGEHCDLVHRTTSIFCARMFAITSP